MSHPKYQTLPVFVLGVLIDRVLDEVAVLVSWSTVSSDTPTVFIRHGDCLRLFVTRDHIVLGLAVRLFTVDEGRAGLQWGKRLSIFRTN